MKTCTRCSADKQLDDFPRESVKKDGRSNWCRECHRLYRLANVQKERERQDRNRARRREVNALWRKENRGRVLEYQRQWARDNPDAVRDSVLRHKFGIGLAQYRDLLSFQGGGCAVCAAATPGGAAGDNPDGFAVDHDHSCCPGKRSCGRCVRALLCNSCNLSIGRLGDTPDSLRRIADLLESPPAAAWRSSLAA